MLHLISIPLLCVLLSGIAFAFLGLLYKVAAHDGCHPTPFSIPLGFTAGGLALLLAFREATAWGDPRLWLLGCAQGLLFYLAVIMLTRANVLGSAAVAWSVLNLSMIVPILLAPVLFHERFFPTDLLLLLLFGAMLVLFTRGVAATGETPIRSLGAYVLALLATFALNGLFMLGYKVKQALFAGQNSGGVTAIMYLSAAGLATLAYLLSPRPRPLLTLKEVRWGALAGIASGCGFVFILGGTVLPSVVVFPLSQGLSLLGGALLTTAIFKEPLNALKVSGLLLGIALLLLAVFREPLALRVGELFALLPH
ncbi:MAG TPA: hypothetical protein VGM23_06810 [Armatimonadota bacterium]